MSFRTLWLAFAAVVVLSFAVLGWTGWQIYQQAPHVPNRIVATDGRELAGPGDVYEGQNVWQSMGGMEVGSVWGHGSYVAPDWTADWLHRESLFIYWYARSPEFLQTDVVQTLRWLRVVGDTIFALGALALSAFVFGLHAAARTIAKS